VIAAGLDVERLYYSEYDGHFLAHVVAWWRAHNLIAVHQADAQNEQARRNARRK
jgi:hypothetical protein